MYMNCLFDAVYFNTSPYLIFIDSCLQIFLNTKESLLVYNVVGTRRKEIFNPIDHLKIQQLNTIGKLHESCLF